MTDMTPSEAAIAWLEFDFCMAIGDIDGAARAQHIAYAWERMIANGAGYDEAEMGAIIGVPVTEGDDDDAASVRG